MSRRSQRTSTAAETTPAPEVRDPQENPQASAPAQAASQVNIPDPTQLLAQLTELVAQQRAMQDRDADAANAQRQAINAYS